MRIHRGGPGEGRRQVIKLPGGKTGKMGSTWWPGDNEDCGDGDGDGDGDDDGDDEDDDDEMAMLLAALGWLASPRLAA